MRGLRKRDRDKGSALVEFALASFTILLVLFLIIDVGRALYAYNWVSNAARQGSRWAMVRGNMCDPLLASYCATFPHGATRSDITNYVNSLAIGIDTNSLQVYSRCWVSGTALAPPPCASPGWVQVQVQYRFHFLSPLFDELCQCDLAWRMISASERAVQQ